MAKREHSLYFSKLCGEDFVTGVSPQNDLNCFKNRLETYGFADQKLFFLLGVQSELCNENDVSHYFCYYLTPLSNKYSNEIKKICPLLHILIARLARSSQV